MVGVGHVEGPLQVPLPDLVVLPGGDGGEHPAAGLPGEGGGEDLHLPGGETFVHADGLKEPVEGGGGRHQDHGFVPPLAEEVAHLLHILPGGTVDDAALAGAALHQLQQRRPLVRRLLDLKIQVLPVKAGGQLQRVPQVQQAADVRLHVRRGGGGEGSHRGPVGQALHKGGDVQVGGPEILAPLGDAVGLVHRHQGDVCLPHKGLEALGLQPLRGHVDDLVPPRPGPVQGQQILAEG